MATATTAGYGNCGTASPATWEIRDRSGLGNLDGSGPSAPYLVPDETLTLVAVLRLAQGLGRTVDVLRGGTYVISYCGACPVWWPPGEHGGGSHDLSSLGWCHTCLDDGRGYVHHLPLADEIAVLTEAAITDRVLARQVEADGQTPAEWAESVVGKAVAKDGYDCLAARVVTGGTYLSPAGLMRQYTVHMRDERSVYRVAVPYDNRPEKYIGGARDFRAATDLAERLACDRPGRPRRCYDCRGLTGHARDCSWTRTRALLLKHPQMALPGDAEEYQLDTAGHCERTAP